MSVLHGAPRRLGLLAIALAIVPGSSHAFDDHLFVVTTDYSTSGSCASVDLESPFAADVNLEPISSDPAVRYHDGRHYVINRFLADNIQVIDAGTFTTLAEHSTGVGTNPQDIVVIDESTAWVSLYETDYLLKMNPITGETLGTLSLASFSDLDGLPEVSMMARDGDHLLIQIQRLDRDFFYEPTGDSYLALVSLSSETLIDVDPGAPGTQGIRLTGTSPLGKMTLDADARRLYVTEIGSYGAADGGVDVIDLDTLDALGFITTEAQHGGDINGFAASTAERGYVLTSTDFFSTTVLVPFRLTDGTPLAPAYTTASFVAGIQHDPISGLLYLADRNATRPGIHAFDGPTGTRITVDPINVGLPPADLAIARDAALSAGDAGPALLPGLPRAWAAPNPARSATRIAFLATSPGAVRAQVFDAGGRSVRTLAGAAAARSGRNEITWDGRNDAGRRVPAGVYHVRVRSTNERWNARVVITE